MSYDLYAFRLPSGESPETVIERMEQEAVSVSKPSATALEHNRDLAEALIQADPSLTPTNTGGQVELDGEHAQMLLWDQYAAINFPIAPEDVDELANRLGSYFRILSDLAGYVIYDPQTEELLDPDRGPRAVIDALTEIG